MNDKATTGPLAGITVLDLTRVLSGPYCTMMLADMGARVIKIEQPGKGDDTRAWGPPFQNGESTYFLSINRNKESVTINLKHEEGKKVIKELLESTDVLVENFRPGTLDRIGFGYKELSNKYPRLVYCSVSGFGHSGPRHLQPGYDAIMQAEGGLMSITGPSDGPGYKLGVSITDITSGMFAAFGVAMALLSRHHTGRGQFVDIGMFDSAAALLSFQASIYFATGQAPGRIGNCHPTIMPYETLETLDDDLVVAVGNDHLWKTFCSVINLQHLAEDDRFASNKDRVKSRKLLKPMIEKQLQMHPAHEWIIKLREHGVPCGSVRDLSQVLTDEQLIERAMVVALEHPIVGAMQTLGIPIKLAGTPGSIRTPPPTLGQHTNEVLQKDLYFDAKKIESLRKSGAI